MKSILILSIFIKSEIFIYWISSDESWIYTDLDTQYLFWQYSPFLNIHLLNIMMVIVNITEFVYYEYYSIHIHNIIIILIRIWLIYHEYVRIWVSIIICDDITRIHRLSWTTSPQKVILHKPLRPRPREFITILSPANWQQLFLRIVLPTPDFARCSLLCTFQ